LVRDASRCAGREETRTGVDEIVNTQA
jgi:hypothetical protein